MSDYHPVTEKITALLSEAGCWFETFEHEPVRTSEEAAAMRPEYTLAEGAKALIVRVTPRGGEKYFMQVVVPGDARFDVKKVKALVNAKDIRFATEDEVGEITEGVLPGGVPPFGTLFGLKVVAEETLLQNKRIIFNAGDRRFSVGMYAEDYLDIVKPTVGDIIS